MMKFMSGISAAVLMTVGGAMSAQAECKSDVPGPEMSFDQAQAVYDCLKDQMHTQYKAGDKQWIPSEFVDDYRGWTQVSTKPAAPGFHGGRFLLTFVNDTGVDAYLQWGEADIPAGTLIAKESFTVGEDGAAEIGPLFIMQKVEEGTSPETDDWYYMMVGPQGRPQAVNVMTACSECHQGNFGEQKGLGFPVPEVRLER